MVSDEIIYTSVLVLCILIGFPLRHLSSTFSKQIITCAIGLLLTFGICKWDGLHSVITFLGNLLIIKASRKHTSIASFLWCFIYLLFFRCATFFALPKPVPLANAIQLILTLKLVSVTFEIHDYRRNRAVGNVIDENDKFQLQLENEPSTFDIFCYAYCYTGLFTGPFFKYRTYYDYLHMNHKISVNIPWKDEIYTRIKQIVLFALLYGLFASFFNISYPKSDKFYNDPLWYRVFYMFPIFFIGRMRFYSGWLLAECSFISLTLGAYRRNLSPRPGHGPTIKSPKNEVTEENLNDYSFDTIQNINPYGCDFSPTVRLGMRNWNMGVQWWLANYVHKRWPKNLKQFRILAVMSVSAFWHGIDPGFFGAFLTMPFVMLAEDLLVEVVKNRLPLSLHFYYDGFNWFAKMRAFEYMYMAFALLTWHDTYRYWKSTYFWLHILSIVIIVLCLFTKKVFPGRKAVSISESSKQK